MLSVIEHIENDTDKVFVENLYREYMPFLRSRVYKQFTDENLCNDLAHDCMCNMIKHLDTLKKLPKNKVRVYISVSIENLLINYRRRSSKQVENRVCDLSDRYDFADDVSVEDEIELKSDYETIRAGIEKLCERDRSVLILKYDLELDDEQIADILEIKKDSVRMTVLRCVRKLKYVIEEQEG